MVIDSANVKRLGIFFFYDKDGIADAYVDHLLKSMSECHQRIIVVSNGSITDETKEMFDKYASDIIVRENKGLDVGAYYSAFVFLGWEEVEKFDEVTLMNHTLMGSVSSVKAMYDRMAEKDLDFWGLSKHFEYDHDVFGKLKNDRIPEHLQSHFLVFRSSLTGTKDFQDYFDNMPEIKDYTDSVSYFEVVFTEKFGNKGYKWDTAVDYEKFRGISYNPIMECPVELLKMGLPFFKRRSVFQDYPTMLYNSRANACHELIEYIKYETDYDYDLVISNAIRSMNQSDFVKAMHLDYILSSKHEDCVDCGDLSICAILFLQYENEINNTLFYIKNLPESVDLILVSNSEKVDIFETEIKKSLKNNLIKIKSESTSEFDVFFEAYNVFSKYDLAMFFHDFQGDLSSRNFYDKVSKAMLYNKTYVKNIINKFKTDKYLGMLVQTTPNHGQYFPLLGNEWRNYFSDASEIVEILGYKVPMHRYKEPVFPYGKMGWFRPGSFKDITKIKYMDAVNESGMDQKLYEKIFFRILPFICQANGYYPAYVIPDNEAVIEIDNLMFEIREYNRIMSVMGISVGTQSEMLAKLRKKRFLFFSVFMGRFAVGISKVSKKILPDGLYDRLIHIKRRIFGPYNLD